MNDSDLRTMIKRTQELRVLANQADACLYRIFDYDKDHHLREFKVTECKKILKRLENLAKKTAEGKKAKDHRSHT
jgi:hypothetical protein